MARRWQLAYNGRMNPSILAKFESKLLKLQSGCWIWQGKKWVILGGVKMSPQRASLRVYAGLEGKARLRMRCANLFCVNVEHIRIRTRNGGPRGERHGHSKLRPTEVLIMRSEFAAGSSYRALAKTYGVTWGCVRDAVLGVSWKHLGPVVRRARRYAHGGQVKQAKLTESTVREIRHRNAQGESQRSLARVYGVTQGCVRQVVHRTTWSHVA